MRALRAKTAMGVATGFLLAMAGCGESAKDSQSALYRFAGADQCDLLRAADPAALLGVEIDPEPLRVYGVCRLHGKQGPPAEWPTTDLEMRVDPEHGVPKDFDEFWEREGAGVELRGAKREQIVELSEIGDYALWYPFPSGQGLQLHAFWGGKNILLITVVGAPVDRAFPWAKQLAKNAVAKASPSISR